MVSLRFIHRSISSQQQNGFFFVLFVAIVFHLFILSKSLCNNHNLFSWCTFNFRLSKIINTVRPKHEKVSPERMSKKHESNKWNKKKNKRKNNKTKKKNIHSYIFIRFINGLRVNQINGIYKFLLDCNDDICVFRIEQMMMYIQDN